jgi:hypothetical protein
MDAVNSAPQNEDGAAEPAEPEEDLSPLHKRHRIECAFRDSVLKVVKQRLDAELKRGGITQEEYKDIAKRATNKVTARTLVRPVASRCAPLPV